MDLIPDYLVDEVRTGKVVLFLGAGASIGARSPKKPYTPPIGRDLGDLLSEKFLGGAEKTKSLAVVAEYSIARSDLRTVQDFIASIFIPFEPSESHRKLSTFRWAAIVTTNYDQIVEA